MALQCVGVCPHHVSCQVASHNATRSCFHNDGNQLRDGLLPPSSSWPTSMLGSELEADVLMCTRWHQGVLIEEYHSPRAEAFATSTFDANRSASIQNSNV
jgi:hypothetical protein